MAVLDIVIVVLLLISAIYGFRKGLVMQIAGLVAVLLGIYCAFRFSGLIAAPIADWLAADNVTVGVAAFIIVVIAVWILVILLGKVLEKMIKLAMLGFVNRLLGALFSAAYTVLILAAIVYAFSFFPVEQSSSISSAIKKSKLYEPLRQVAKTVFPYIDFKKISVKSLKI